MASTTPRVDGVMRRADSCVPNAVVVAAPMARGLESELREALALLRDCRTWLDPKTTGDEDSEALCWRIDRVLRSNAVLSGAATEVKPRRDV